MLLYWKAIRAIGKSRAGNVGSGVVREEMLRSIQEHLSEKVRCERSLEGGDRQASSYGRGGSQAHIQSLASHLTSEAKAIYTE